MLTNFVGKPFAALFSEFQGNPANPEDVQGSGDVSIISAPPPTATSAATRPPVADRQSLASRGGRPVVLGKVRAKQRQRGDTERTQVAGC